MSRQSNNARNRKIAEGFTHMHLRGEKGPTPPGGPFICSWRAPKQGKSKKK